MHNDFREAGYRVFGLHPILPDGSCGCGWPDCKAAGKHPIMSCWQYAPDWSDEQWDVMHEAGQFDSGYGVLLSGLIVIDVDARNGGVESYGRLLEAVPEIAGAGLVVETGSGGGSKHLYFRIDLTIPVVTKLFDYKGIDFKNGSSFVVGPGSMHKSGKRYRAVIGSPYDIAPAPQALIDLIKKPDLYRAAYDGKHVDLADQDIQAMLSHIDPDCGYDTWVKCGMSAHHATQGAGFHVWDKWSSGGRKYPGSSSLESKWHSFGKSINPVTIGTLIHYAKEGGWVEPVTFVSDDDFEYFEEQPKDGLPFSIDGVDLLRPPGFVGELAEWIDSCGISSRGALSVAAALVSMGNLAGLRYKEDLTDVGLNLFCFCVAGSGSGKESILKAFGQIHIAASLGPAVHGNFKSEQELISNIIHHQAAFYAVDEMGTVLSKIENARRGGGTPYFDGLIGQIMSIFSKSRGNFLLTGDRKREIKDMLSKKVSSLVKKIDNGEDKDGACLAKKKKINAQIDTIEKHGIINPFLSIFGPTTPETFNRHVSPDFVKNGFMSRALFFDEKDNNPKFRKLTTPSEMPEKMKMAIAAIANGGVFDLFAERVEYHGERVVIKTNPAAKEMLEDVVDYFWEMGEQYKESNGFESITRRGYELTSKVSAILAAPSGVRTEEHVRWAFALVVRDMNEKALLAFSNDNDKKHDDRLATKILTRIDKEHGETVAVLFNRIKGSSKDEIEKTLKYLEKNNLVVKKVIKNYRRQSEKWFRK